MHWTPYDGKPLRLYHGTVYECLVGITTEGLSPMAKTSIYFSTVPPLKGLVPRKGDSEFTAIITVEAQVLQATGLFDIYQRPLCAIVVPRVRGNTFAVTLLGIHCRRPETGDWGAYKSFQLEPQQPSQWRIG